MRTICVSLLAEFNAFGLRSPASDQHQASLDWLADQLRVVPGMRVEWDEYRIDRWQPTTDAPGDTPGRDLAAAGGLTVGGADVPVIGAVPFSRPTTPEDDRARPLVHIPADPAVAIEDAFATHDVAGKIVVFEIAHVATSYSAYDLIGHYVTDDIPHDGNYDRPYARHLVPTIAGASGPWSLWAPSFGADAVDFERMRNQILAFGDVALGLGGVPREEIAGTCPAARQRRAAGGVKTCTRILTPPAVEAPAG